jgi:DNA helicase-2/ATP-dependent DNA helicase PcrA
LEKISPAKSGQFTISINKSYSKPVYNKPVVRPAISHEYDEYSQVEPKLTGKVAWHNKFGKGKVVGQSGSGANTQVEVLFADGVKRKLVLKFANLRFD